MRDLNPGPSDCQSSDSIQISFSFAFSYGNIWYPVWKTEEKRLYQEKYKTTTNTLMFCWNFLSKPQDQPAWWGVTLQRRAFVSKIWIINSLGCCLAEMPEHNVILRNSVETEKANCKVYSWKDRQKTLMICEPLISASNVTIKKDGVGDLRICEVMITAIGEKCKRFLFHVHWFFNSNLLINIIVYHPPRKEKLL